VSSNRATIKRDGLDFERYSILFAPATTTKSTNADGDPLKDIAEVHIRLVSESTGEVLEASMPIPREGSP
jgi:hypothetical protein